MHKPHFDEDHAGRPQLHGISDETAAVVQGLREKAEEFRKGGGEIYRRA